MGCELLAPAGNFETALAAFEAGADAVYCGLTEFSARAFADNFSLEDLKNLLRYTQGNRVRLGSDRADEGSVRRRRVYVTFNTVIDEDNLDAAIEQLARLDEIGPDALIVQDIGVARICRRHFPELELHASTQLVAHNLEGVLAMKELGFKRVVLARELSLEEIASIAKRCGDIELEVFVHGALCYSISGLCLFGAMEKGRSGNRGKCPYCCRLPYEDEAGEKTLCFSMKDLRLGEDVRKLADAGVASLKIEGRMKSALYVASVTRYYRQILGSDRVGLGSDRVGLESDRVGLGSDRVGLGLNRVVLESDRVGLGSDRVGLGSNRVGLGSDRVGLGSNRVGAKVTVADLETVFSRRTTKLYFDGRTGTASARQQEGGRLSDGVIDSASLGHLGAEIGVVKRVTKDREGRSWLRFHTARGLEKHDGLQFEAMVDGRHVGMAVVEMRQAISRRPVFEVNAGTDVEVLLPQDATSANDLTKILKPGMKIYCSMSNAVKRMFPTPSFRPSDYEGGTTIDVEVKLRGDGVFADAREDNKRTTASASAAATASASAAASAGSSASASAGARVAASAGAGARVAASAGARVEIACELQPAKNPEKTVEGVRKAFAKLGGSDYRLGRLRVDDPEKLFAPMSVLNDLRRDLVERLDEAREKARREKAGAAIEEEENAAVAVKAVRRVKVRVGQPVPPGEWDEVVVAIGSLGSDRVDLGSLGALGADRVDLGAVGPKIRLAQPVWTAEPEFNRLRVTVKGLLRKGFDKWEASDLATLRMLRSLGVTDITADWTLYAFNSRALAELSGMGVRRFVASPENNRENLQYLAESGYDVEFLTQQSTPLFVSLTAPAARPEELAVFQRDGLWVTTKPVPRTFETPDGVSTRVDLSWDPE